MKRKLIAAAAVCAVLILCSCEEPRATNAVPDYPFETLHGSWIRNGNIGAMGVTKLKSYTKNGKQLMEWTVQDVTTTLECDAPDPAQKGTTSPIQNPRPGLYIFGWYEYDATTDTSAPQKFMSIKVAIEERDDIYMATDANGMGGLTMTRVK